MVLQVAHWCSGSVGVILGVVLPAGEARPGLGASLWGGCAGVWPVSLGRTSH
jgi:hypothetical protein